MVPKRPAIMAQTGRGVGATVMSRRRQNCNLMVLVRIESGCIRRGMQNSTPSSGPAGSRRDARIMH
eukprot:3159133-Rhodomonas_salina.1